MWLAALFCLRVLIAGLQAFVCLHLGLGDLQVEPRIIGRDHSLFMLTGKRLRLYQVHFADTHHVDGFFEVDAILLYVLPVEQGNGGAIAFTEFIGRMSFTRACQTLTYQTRVLHLVPGF